jgi:hypothetical protein
MMTVEIKNMVCEGTKSFVMQEMERLGLKYHKFEAWTIEFKEDLSLTDMRKLGDSLYQYGLELTYGKIVVIENAISQSI